MANVRIDNASDDGFTLFFDDQQFFVQEDEKLTVPDVKKGKHTLRIHRTRIPRETSTGRDSEETDIREKAEKSDISVHTQLDLIFDIELNSSKGIITVSKSVTEVEKISTDALFSCYSVIATGLQVISEKKVFANKNVRKNFALHQIKNAFVPIGIGGIIFLIMGLVSLVSNMNGKALEFGTHKFTMPWAIGLLSVALVCFCYVIFVMVKTHIIIKNYRE